MNRRVAKWMQHEAAVPLSVAAVLVVLFVVIVQLVRGGEPSHSDVALSRWVHGFRAAWLDAVMVVATDFGARPVLAAVAAAVSFYLWTKGARFNAAMVAATSLLGGVLNTLLKLFFARSRPELFERVTEADGYSFPSGHAMGATVIFGLSALALGHVFKMARVGIWAGAVLVIAVIGLSRIYLGVHWPTDVVGGFCAGGALVFAASWVLRRPAP